MWMRTVNLSPLVSLSIKCGATGGKWKVCRSYHVLELEIVRTNETGSLDEDGILVWELKSKLRPQENQFRCTLIKLLIN